MKWQDFVKFHTNKPGFRKDDGKIDLTRIGNLWKLYKEGKYNPLDQEGKENIEEEIKKEEKKEAEKNIENQKIVTEEENNQQDIKIIEKNKKEDDKMGLRDKLPKIKRVKPIKTRNVIILMKRRLDIQEKKIGRKETETSNLLNLYRQLNVDPAVVDLVFLEGINDQIFEAISKEVKANEEDDEEEQATFY